ncbi:hypothetical protein LOK49_LG01G01850 [Camellia lanceoleosa]|uniref:Uncharacterized protein n=1 Tax=Camellia lanceoleosa TaxID=1840588 RepID=A0ACC0J1I2_9ERIC|nr:hypothetical protein LOK49_LG01G01850 [Camellia lanceoleosa]
MSSSFSKSPFSLLLFFFFICALSVSLTVRSDYSDSSIIRLPVDDAGALCAGTAPPPSCPVRCFRTDPVCGVDGVTYWCGCADALCSGTRVAKLGFCEVGNGGSGSLSGQAFLLVHIVWLILLGFSVLFGLL